MKDTILILTLSLSFSVASHTYPQNSQEEEAQLKQAIANSLKTTPAPFTLPTPFVGIPEVYSLHIDCLAKFIAELETRISKSAEQEEKLELTQFLERMKDKQKNSQRFGISEARERSLIRHAQNIIAELRRDDESLPTFYFSKFKTFDNTLKGWEEYLKEQINDKKKKDHLVKVFERKMKEKRDAVELALKEYRSMISRVGKIQTAPFVEIVHSILSISCGDSGLSTKKILWELMKKTGFIRSSIDCVENFMYSPFQITKNFLKENPTFRKLVIACGHFLSSKICEDILYTRREASCGVCDKAPHLEEITMSLQARDNPDILADVCDTRFWDAIPDLHFDSISDDSLGWICVMNNLTDAPFTDAHRRKLANIDTSRRVLDEVYRTIKPKGQFIISVASESSVQPAKEKMAEEKKFKYLRTDKVSDTIFDVIFEKQ